MSTDIERRLEEIESRERIRDLIAGYCLGLDNHDIEAFVDLWHPDAEMLFGEGLGDFYGQDQIRAAITDVIWPGLPESHHWTMNVVIEFAGPDRAESISDLSLVALTDEDRYVFIAATYRDVFERREGEWRFSRRHCVIHFRFPLAAGAANVLRAD